MTGRAAAGPRGRAGVRMSGRRCWIVAALLCAVSLLAAAPALAEETVSITEAGFSPNALDTPTNAFGSDVYGPAGVTLNLEGTGICVRERLEQLGPQGCPADSKAGFGGGQGVYELAH